MKNFPCVNFYAYYTDGFQTVSEKEFSELKTKFGVDFEEYSHYSAKTEEVFSESHPFLEDNVIFLNERKKYCYLTPFIEPTCPNKSKVNSILESLASYRRFGAFTTIHPNLFSNIYSDRIKNYSDLCRYFIDDIVWQFMTGNFKVDNKQMLDKVIDKEEKMLKTDKKKYEDHMRSMEPRMEIGRLKREMKGYESDLDPEYDQDYDFSREYNPDRIEREPEEFDSLEEYYLKNYKDRDIKSLFYDHPEIQKEINDFFSAKKRAISNDTYQNYSGEKESSRRKLVLPKRKTSKRKTSKRKLTKRKSTKRKSTKRKSTNRKSKPSKKSKKRK